MDQAVLSWLNSPAFTSFGAPTSWAELLGFITGALCVYLVARQHVANWPVGIANNVLFVVLFANAGLYGNSSLQLVYIVLAVWGWWQWTHGGAERAPLPVTRSPAANGSRSAWAASSGRAR